ncbi:MAG: ORF6N domain-containing protein [Candidatus Margulisiibacteriota bacterium]
MSELMPIERIENRIYLIRGHKVLLDRDLAQLYGVETKYLNRQVKRNLSRFPAEYMFQLTEKEKAKVVTNWHHLSSLRFSHQLPYAFTEHGVAMLSAVLNSPRAVKVSILIINTFIRLRQLLAGNKELAKKIEKLEVKHSKHELEITTIFKVLKKLLAPPPPPPAKKIGFIQ